jgi:hypothetical protein
MKRCLYPLVLLVMFSGEVPAAEWSRVSMSRAGNAVDIENGLVKARFISDGKEIHRQCFAAHSDSWVLLVEDFKPGKSVAGQAHGPLPALYDTSIDPAHRLLMGELLQESTGTGRYNCMSVSISAKKYYEVLQEKIM